MSDSDVYEDEVDDMEVDDDVDELQDPSTDASFGMERKYKILPPADLIKNQLEAIDQIHEIFQVLTLH